MLMFVIIFDYVLFGYVASIETAGGRQPNLPGNYLKPQSKSFLLSFRSGGGRMGETIAFVVRLIKGRGCPQHSRLLGGLAT